MRRGVGLPGSPFFGASCFGASVLEASGLGPVGWSGSDWSRTGGVAADELDFAVCLLEFPAVSGSGSPGLEVFRCGGAGSTWVSVFWFSPRKCRPARPIESESPWSPVVSSRWSSSFCIASATSGSAFGDSCSTPANLLMALPMSSSEAPCSLAISKAPGWPIRGTGNGTTLPEARQARAAKLIGW